MKSMMFMVLRQVIRMTKLKVSELQRLSDDELKKLALQRHKGGRKKSTTTAIRAQYILWKRAGEPFMSEDHFLRNQTPTGIKFQDLGRDNVCYCWAWNCFGFSVIFFGAVVLFGVTIGIGDNTLVSKCNE